MSVYDGPATSLGTFNKAVASAGTQEQITSTSTPIAWVVITAAPGNSGSIAVGGANADATADAELGVSLAAGDSIALPINDLSAVWIDATTSGDEVSGLYGRVSG